MMLFTFYMADPSQCKSTTIHVCTIVDDPKYRGRMLMLDGHHRRDVFKKMMEQGVNAHFYVVEWRGLTIAEANEMFFEFNHMFFKRVDDRPRLLEDAYNNCCQRFSNMYGDRVREKYSVAMAFIKPQTLKDVVCHLMRDCTDVTVPANRLAEFNAKLLAAPDHVFTREYTGRIKLCKDERLSQNIAKARKTKFMLGLFKDAKHIIDALTRPSIILGDIQFTSQELDWAWQEYNRDYCTTCTKDRKMRTSAKLHRRSACFVWKDAPESGGRYTRDNLLPCCADCMKWYQVTRNSITQVKQSTSNTTGTCVTMVPQIPCKKRRLQPPITNFVSKSPKCSNVTATTPVQPSSSATSSSAPRSSASSSAPRSSAPDVASNVLSQVVDAVKEMWEPVTTVSKITTKTEMNLWCNMLPAIANSPRNERPMILEEALGIAGIHLQSVKNKTVYDKSGQERKGLKDVWMCVEKSK